MEYFLQAGESFVEGEVDLWDYLKNDQILNLNKTHFFHL